MTTEHQQKISFHLSFKNIFKTLLIFHKFSHEIYIYFLLVLMVSDKAKHLQVKVLKSARKFVGFRVFGIVLCSILFICAADEVMNC